MRNTNVKLKCRKSKIEKSREILPSTRVPKSNINSVPLFQLPKSRHTRTRFRFWRKVWPKLLLISKKRKKWSVTSTSLSSKSNVRR